MHLTPGEQDRLLIFTTAELARRRRARGLRLNVPEATALIADAVCEAARDGARHADAVQIGRSLLTLDDVLPGVSDVMQQVSVEAVFDDGTRLVVVTDPFGVDASMIRAHHAETAPASGITPAVVVTMRNTAAVTIRVSSHVHGFELNPRIAFDRAAAWGMHVALPAGESLALAPDVPVEVGLVPFRGARVLIGFSGFVDGPLDEPGVKERALDLVRACGYADTEYAGPADPERAVAARMRHLRASSLPGGAA